MHLAKNGTFTGDRYVAHHHYLTATSQGVSVDSCNQRLSHTFKVPPTVQQAIIKSLGQQRLWSGVANGALNKVG